jgi:hypothetical protein
MKRETVTIDRARLFLALASLRRTLIQGDATAGLRALDAIYRLLPIQPEQPRSNTR